MKLDAKILLLIPLLLLLAGCNNDGGNSQQNTGGGSTTNSPDKPTTPNKPGKVTVKVEVMPESSEEATRIHKFNELGVEIETEIKFRDGGLGLESRHPLTRNVTEYVRYFKGGTDVKTRIKYSSDGKNIVLEESFYAPGKVERRRERLPDGSLRAVEFYESGIEQTQYLVRPDGSGHQINHDDNSNGEPPMLRFKAEWTADGHASVEEYNNEAVLEARSQLFPDGTARMERFNNGKLSVVEFLRARVGAELEHARTHFLHAWAVEKAEVYDEESGELVRILVFFKTDLNRTQQATIMQEDGKKAVIELDETGKWISHKIFDADGKLLEEVDPELEDSALVELPDSFTMSPGFEPNNYAEQIREMFRKQ
ncbi:MAG: hypothetical protein K2X77_30755 [Candidatus Obscuribacterales bacterium]|jgi:hypothetical protein|nr:hypothetical protein [Candidatus Obscuribacterales bacterium]